MFNVESMDEANLGSLYLDNTASYRMHFTFKHCCNCNADTKISFSCSSKGRQIHSIVGRGHQPSNGKDSDIIWSVNILYGCVKT